MCIDELALEGIHWCRAAVVLDVTINSMQALLVVGAN